VIIERVICIARVRTASRSANGNELTLARERQAKQNFAQCGLRHFLPGLGSGYWHFPRLACVAIDDLRFDAGRMTIGRYEWIADDRVDER
jgi:hypothetical protein